MKILPNGIAVLQQDTHISKWVEEHGRLDHDRWLLDLLEPYIKSGDWVVDAGSFIGDHSIAYARYAGITGRVIAFEPNFHAFKCLEYNVSSLPQVQEINAALSDGEGKVAYLHRGPNCNEGMACIKDPEVISEEMMCVKTLALDDLYLERLNFLKMDIEGYEHKALIGAKKTICKFKPIILLEINKEALARNGSSFSDIRGYLNGLGYKNYKVLQPNVYDLHIESQFDALFFHESKCDL